MGLDGWRDAAIVLLVVESFAGVLIVGAVFYFSVRGVLWLKERIPTITRPVGAWLGQAERATRHAGDTAITPFVWAGASVARARAVWKQLAKNHRRSTHV
jgi:hypothetical protein